jgi:hypothetical protein
MTSLITVGVNQIAQVSQRSEELLPINEYINHSEEKLSVSYNITKKQRHFSSNKQPDILLMKLHLEFQ